MTALSCASASLSDRYTCPDDGRATFDSSPATHTDGNASSIRPLRPRVSSPTLRTLVPSGIVGTAIASLPPHPHEYQRRALLVAHRLHDFRGDRRPLQPFRLLQDTVRRFSRRG